MLLLSRVAAFRSNRQDLKRIFLTYIRSIVDQLAVVWHSSLTEKNKNDIERIQKVAVRIILGKNYTIYNATRFLGVGTLTSKHTFLLIL